MNKLNIIRFLIYTILLVISSKIAPAQQTFNGSGTREDPYEIGSTQNWKTLERLINDGVENYATAYYIMTRDIELGTGDNPFEHCMGNDEHPFRGVFDGNNNTLTIKMTPSTEVGQEATANYAAPFGVLDGGTIQNLTVAGSITTTKTGQYAAGVVAYAKNEAKIFSCISTVTIFINPKYVPQYAAGIAAYINYCDIQGEGDEFGNKCQSSVKISYKKGEHKEEPSVRDEKVDLYAGGLVAYSIDSNIDYCVSKDVEINAGYYVGGLIGYIGKSSEGESSVLLGCSSSGTITSGLYTGGMVGYADGANIDFGPESGIGGSGCSTSVEISSGDYIGGFIAYAKDSNLHFNECESDVTINAGDYNAGYIAYSGNSNVNIENSNSNANITVSREVGAGFIAYLDKSSGNKQVNIKSCVSNDVIATTDHAAGFIGVLRSSANITGCTSQGTINSNGLHAGGFISDDEGVSNITNCTSKITINAYKDGSVFHSGFVGLVKAGEANFKNCVFQGTIQSQASEKPALCCTGFVGQLEIQSGGEGKVTYDHCLQRGTITTDDSGTFHLPLNWDEKYVPTAVELYYFNNVEANPNADKILKAPTETSSAAAQKILGNKLSKIINDGKVNHYVPAAVITPEISAGAVYSNPFEPVVSYYGSNLTNGNQYTYTPDYAGGSISITGKTGYYGTITVNTSFVTLNTWADLVSLMDGQYNDKARIITLNKNYTAGKNDGPIVVKGTGPVTLNLKGKTLNRNLYDGSRVSNGNVIKVYSGATLTINGTGNITGANSIGNGGGIVNDGTLILNNVTVTRNKTSKSSKDDRTDYATGGGVYNSGPSFTMIGGVLTNNTCYGGGGGVNTSCSSGSFYMEGVTVSGNQSKSKGAGIRVDLSTNAHVKNCKIFDNKADGTENNEIASDGGGVHNNANNTLFENCEIYDNYSSFRGGGVYQLRGSITLKNCIITGNASINNSNIGGGGGLYIASGSITLDDSEVVKNTSNTAGGAFVQGGNLYVQNKVIIDNNNGDARKMNVFLDTDKNIMIAKNKSLATNSLIGVSKVIKSGADNVHFTSGLQLGTSSPKGSIKSFRSDDYMSYRVVKDGQEASLKESLRWRAAYSTPEKYKDAASATAAGAELYTLETEGNNIYHIDAPLIIGSEDDAVITHDKISLGAQGAIFIEETCKNKEYKCGQLEYNGSQPVQLTLLKIVKAADGSEKGEDGIERIYGWYTIASPVNNAKIAGENANTNIITAYIPPYNFDLLRYVEYGEPGTGGENGQIYISPAGTENGRNWEYYDAAERDNSEYPFTHMENGRGYLYRNAQALTVEYNGLSIQNDVTCSMTYTEDHIFNEKNYSGYSIIGNPFTHNIRKGNVSIMESGYSFASGFYTLSQEGEWHPNTDDKAEIVPGQGVMVQVVKDDKTIQTTPTQELTARISKSTKDLSRYNHDNIGFVVANSQYEDVAYAMFDKGYGLDKIDHVNIDAPMVYINREGRNYAVATMSDDVKVFDLNFKAKTAGAYTLSYTTEGSFNYLHVIDRLTGRDVDMLAAGEYSFIASPYDTDARFIVNLRYKPNYDNGSFAYQSGNDIIVSGEGELQVFDVAGRMIANKHINGVETISTSSVPTGVYILRIVGNEILTQKIVVK